MTEGIGNLVPSGERRAACLSIENFPVLQTARRVVKDYEREVVSFGFCVPRRILVDPRRGSLEILEMVNIFFGGTLSWGSWRRFLG